MATRLGAALAVGRGQVNEQAPFSLSPVTLMQLAANHRLVLPSPTAQRHRLPRPISAPPSSPPTCATDERLPVRSKACFRSRVIAAGERQANGSLWPGLEDLIGVGAVIEALSGTRSPESSLAVAAWTAAQKGLDRMIKDCASGRELVQSGHHEDVHMACEVDVSNCVPRWSDGAFIRSVSP
ncbi:MAG: 2-phosphosulfolactate phosphatase [Actinomycetota bacterium]|nr:2-phosphosulfolactate phosphatase [Actinomycetota bacterium]